MLLHRHPSNPQVPTVLDRQLIALQVSYRPYFVDSLVQVAQLTQTRFMSQTYLQRSDSNLMCVEQMNITKMFYQINRTVCGINLGSFTL